MDDAPSIQLRLAAILAGDIAGYSARSISGFSREHVRLLASKLT
jgi:hypothetical protein